MRAIFCVSTRTVKSLALNSSRNSTVQNMLLGIWGQSGYGKTTMMSEIAKGYAALGHCIVIFDSGSSFTNNSLKYFYNDEFINENINIIDLGKDDFLLTYSK